MFVSFIPTFPHLTLFFFVISGLVYEAIATASADVSSALTALNFLVCPEYSKPSIFEEFISLCYRMGMTEAAGIQIHLIEMLAIFAATLQHSGSTGFDILSLTSPPAYCLRICSHILKQVTLPSRATVLVSFTLSPVLLRLRDWRVRTESQPSDLIAVISTAITAFTSIANSITLSHEKMIVAWLYS
jgi:HEAT repeat-containing protein 5